MPLLRAHIPGKSLVGVFYTSSPSSENTFTTQCLDLRTYKPPVGFVVFNSMCTMCYSRTGLCGPGGQCLSDLWGQQGLFWQVEIGRKKNRRERYENKVFSEGATYCKALLQFNLFLYIFNAIFQGLILISYGREFWSKEPNFHFWRLYCHNHNHKVSINFSFLLIKKYKRSQKVDAKVSKKGMN